MTEDSMVTVRYFAAAKAATGVVSERIDLEHVDGGATRGGVENHLISLHPEAPTGERPLAEVLARSSFLLDGQSCPTPDTPIHGNATLDVLPPFAGG
ncbi:MoaD/ThiS family protein [Kocuria sp.]|uniref:MoaD/ThiS family protein n=1 Tax=Kocuria sp. TaxID=1871328 RepID=UPI0026E0EAE5|nr:MoaD/ThiS family protein [Kocuria sp.]MDO5617833.1 MoaD/ThiS family protein [Kocuria sp.]